MISFIVIISLAWSIFETYNNPKGAYFSSFTRAWQLGLGALLALLVYSKQSEISLKIRYILSLVGVGLIMYSWLTFNGNTLFPGFLALLPTVGAAALIAAGASESNSPLPNILLSLKPVKFIGRISYSLYLWHWPVIILMTYKFSQNEQSVVFRAFTILVILTLSILSFFFVEKPTRNIKVPESLSKKSRNKENRTPIQRFDLIKYSAFAMLILTTFVLVISLTTRNTGVNLSSEQRALLENQTKEAIRQDLSGDNTTSYGLLLSKWKSEVASSANLLAIPKTMDPPLSNLLSDRGKQWNQCLDPKSIKQVTCEFGNSSAQKTAVILGDSNALAIYPTVLGALDLSKWRVIALNRHQCMIANVIPFLSGRPDDSCAIHRKWANQYAINLKPDLIVLSDNTNTPISLNGKELVDGRQDYWRNALEASLKQLVDSGATIYYFGQPPGQRPLLECVDSNQNLTASCLGRPSGNIVQRGIQKEISGKYGVNFVSMNEWICGGNSCPPIIANTPVFWDGGHFSKTFAAKMAPLFKALLAEKNIS